MIAFILSVAGVAILGVALAKRLSRKPGRSSLAPDLFMIAGITFTGVSSILNGTLWLSGTCAFLVLTGVVLAVASARSRRRNARSS